MIEALALLLTIAGCACFYLASPHQRWLSRPAPARPLRVAASLLLAAALVVWITALRVLPGLFVTLHVTMVCLFACPYVTALRGAGRRD